MNVISQKPLHHRVLNHMEPIFPLTEYRLDVVMSDAKLFANRSALFANDAESAMIACSLL